MGGYQKLRMNPVTGLLDLIGLDIVTVLENTDIDTGTETVDSLADTDGKAAFWAYSVSKGGTEFRAGIIQATWDGVADSVSKFADALSTEDIGDTSGVVFSVDKSGNTVRLRCTVASDDWAVHVARLLIG